MVSFWKDWCWSWNSNTLATSCEELTHWKRPWCWEGLGAGGEGDDRGWDGWIASPTRWAWVWVGSRSWWWTRRPCVLRFMGSWWVGHNWATELNWTELKWLVSWWLVFESRLSEYGAYTHDHHATLCSSGQCFHLFVVFAPALIPSRFWNDSEKWLCVKAGDGRGIQGQAFSLR